MYFNVRVKLSFTVERRSAIILIFLFFSLFCQKTIILKVLLILYTNFICPKSQRVICADYLLCPCWWLSWQLPAPTASRPGGDSRSCHSCEWPWGSSCWTLTEAPQGARAPLKPKAVAARGAWNQGKETQGRKRLIKMPEGVSCGRGKPWMSFYPALQILTLILSSSFGVQLVCRVKWQKNTFKASYAPVSPWSLLCLRRGRLLQFRDFAGKILCQILEITWTLPSSTDKLWKHTLHSEH